MFVRTNHLFDWEGCLTELFAYDCHAKLNWLLNLVHLQLVSLPQFSWGFTTLILLQLVKGCHRRNGSAVWGYSLPLVNSRILASDGFNLSCFGI